MDYRAIKNIQNPPVSVAQIESDGMTVMPNFNGYPANILRDGKYVGRFNDVQWRHGASGMLFIKDTAGTRERG